MSKRVLVAARGRSAPASTGRSTSSSAARAARPARLRPPRDRPQRPRRQADLEGLGAVFVEDEDEMPEGALVVLSAHGVAPLGVREVRRARPPGRRRRLPARLQGARRGAPLRRARAQDRPRRPRGPRRGGAGRWREAPDAIVVIETPGSEALELEEGQSGGRTSRRRRSPSTTPPPIVEALATTSPTSAAACRRTSATRRRTGRTPSRRGLRGGVAAPRRRLRHELEREAARRGRPGSRGDRCDAGRRRARARRGVARGA